MSDKKIQMKPANSKKTIVGIAILAVLLIGAVLIYNNMNPTTTNGIRSQTSYSHFLQEDGRCYELKVTKTYRADGTEQQIIEPKQIPCDTVSVP